MLGLGRYSFNSFASLIPQVYLILIVVGLYDSGFMAIAQYKHLEIDFPPW